jgi:hypothetical protein
VSAIEQEPQVFNGVTLGTSEGVAVTFPVAGASLDTPLSAILIKPTPFKAIRIRGIIVVTSATATHFSAVKLRQGNNTTSGPQVQSTLSQQAATTDPTGGAFVPFEFVDFGPTTLYYSLTATVSTAATGLVVVNITGFTG